MAMMAKPRSTIGSIKGWLPWLAAVGSIGCGVAPTGLTAGTWWGDLKYPDRAERLELLVDSGAAKATVSIASWQMNETAGTIRRLSTDSLELAAVHGTDTVMLRGALARGAFRGEARHGNDLVPFELRQVRLLTDSAWAAIVGTYRARDGLIGIAPFAEFGPGVRLIDYRTGRLGPLIPVSDDRFLVGHSVIAPLWPADTMEVQRGQGGQLLAIRWFGRRQPETVAERVATRDEEVQFSNGPVTLRGTLTIPPDSGPHPAIVIVHGSGPLTRQVLEPWARFFAGQGYAVLSYDKRGTGQSTGDWKQSDFAALAGDVHAGVQLLAGRADIRHDRIGLWGASQAGWIMPLVASTWPGEVAFMIVHAGTGTTVREQGVLNMGYEYRFHGATDSIIAMVTHYRMLDDAVTRTGKGEDELVRYYRAHREEAQLWEPAPADDPFRRYYRMLMDFDPAGSWARVKIPVLLFFGELDANVPPKESWPPIERALARAGNTEVTHYLLPKANHLFFEAQTGAREEYPGLSRFVSGYFDRMAEWLHKPPVGRDGPTP